MTNHGAVELKIKDLEGFTLKLPPGISSLELS